MDSNICFRDQPRSVCSTYALPLVPGECQSILLIEDEITSSKSNEDWKRRILQFVQYLFCKELPLIFVAVAVVVIPFGSALWGLRNRHLTGHIHPKCPLPLPQQRRVLKSFKVCSMNEVLALRSISGHKRLDVFYRDLAVWRSGAQVWEGVGAACFGFEANGL